MVFTMLAERRNSPSSGRLSTSRRTVCVKLPCATAAMARVTSVIGRRRSSVSVLTEPSISPQAPWAMLNRTRSRIFPSLPSVWPRRLSSSAICWLADTISLKVSAIRPVRPVQTTGSLTEKSPFRTLRRVWRIKASSEDSSGVGLPFVRLVRFFSTVGAADTSPFIVPPRNLGQIDLRRNPSRKLLPTRDSELVVREYRIFVELLYQFTLRATVRWFLYFPPPPSVRTEGKARKSSRKFRNLQLIATTAVAGRKVGNVVS